MAVTFLLPPPPSPFHTWWTGDVLTAAREARGAASQHGRAQLLLQILSVLHGDEVLFFSTPKQAASNGLWRGPGDVPGAVGAGVNHSKAPSPHSSRECLPEPPGQGKQEKEPAPALL